MVFVVTIMFTGKDLHTAIKYYVANKKSNRACYLIVYLHQYNNITQTVLFEQLYSIYIKFALKREKRMPF